MIPALVLTAGLATRLRPLSLVRAKAAMPVAGQPLVRRILRWLRSSGVVDVVLNLHHLPHTITQRIGDGSDLGMRVRYSWEVPILGSAGGPRLALPLLDSRTFLVVNGDTLTDIDVPSLVDAHRRSGALVTMAVTAHDDTQRYGGVVSDDEGTVTGFAARGSAVQSRHFVGVQVVEADAFATVPAGAAAESVAGLYPELIRKRPGVVRAHEVTAEFFDIGRAPDYLRTSLLLVTREGGPTHGLRTESDATARIDESLLWDDVTIGAGAHLHRCIVADGAQVPPFSSWSDVTLRPYTGELAPGERLAGALAVAPLYGRS